MKLKDWQQTAVAEALAWDRRLEQYDRIYAAVYRDGKYIPEAGAQAYLLLRGIINAERAIAYAAAFRALTGGVDMIRDGQTWRQQLSALVDERCPEEAP